MNRKNNKKGFTLIELLAVIIILAVIALIATPIVLNVVDNAKKQANKNSVYGLLDGAKLYYTESLLDSNKSANINGTTNLINEISISGQKPESGSIYINRSGETALAVVYDKVCYKKNFNENEITELSDVDNCSLNIEEAPQVSYKCKRATTLHTEECTQTETIRYCGGAGYEEGQTITYGSLGTKGILTSGDAFDCDVNGDGVYDSETERFYYVSDYYNTTSKSFDDSYAVLIYYSNTALGVADNTESSFIVYYEDANENYHGPVTAITNLPTTSQWSNVSLANVNRALLTETGTTETPGGTLPTEFSYSGYAARLLTVQEINSACGIIVGSSTYGELDTCNFLMENTGFSNKLSNVLGYWLENPSPMYSSSVWQLRGDYRKVDYGLDAYYSDGYGIRPAIEVLKTDIEY